MEVPRLGVKSEPGGEAASPQGGTRGAGGSAGLAWLWGAQLGPYVHRPPQWIRSPAVPWPHGSWKLVQSPSPVVAVPLGATARSLPPTVGLSSRGVLPFRLPRNCTSKACVKFLLLCPDGPIRGVGGGLRPAGSHVYLLLSVVEAGAWGKS